VYTSHLHKITFTTPFQTAFFIELMFGKSRYKYEYTSKQVDINRLVYSPSKSNPIISYTSGVSKFFIIGGTS